MTKKTNIKERDIAIFQNKKRNSTVSAFCTIKMAANTMSIRVIINFIFMLLSLLLLIQLKIVTVIRTYFFSKQIFNLQLIVDISRA